MLTGNKDVDRKILNNLEDEDLVNMCQVNKKIKFMCNDQVFWMNRVFLRFGYVGGNILRTNKDKYWNSWSEYYIKDLRKINNTNAQKYLINESGNGRLDHVIISLKNGANIHGLDEYSLRVASRCGHLDIVKYIVELKGANIYAQDDYALRWASLNGYIEVVKYLMGLKPDGANIHAKDDYALRWASLNGHIEVVKYLVELKPDGANIHALDDEALRYSSRYGYLDVVKYLVELKPDGANIHAQDDYALRWASSNGHIEVVKYIKNVMANPNLKDL